MLLLGCSWLFFGIFLSSGPSDLSSNPASIHPPRYSVRRNQVKNIFVGNLSYETTEHSLRSLFEEFGSVDRASVVTDRDTGRAKGFGFVEMSVDAEGDRAIAELNGQEMGGRALTVNEARPREERGGYAGGAQRRNRY